MSNSTFIFNNYTTDIVSSNMLYHILHTLHFIYVLFKNTLNKIVNQKKKINLFESQLFQIKTKILEVPPLK